MSQEKNDEISRSRRAGTSEADNIMHARALYAYRPRPAYRKMAVTHILHCYGLRNVSSASVKLFTVGDGTQAESGNYRCEQPERLDAVHACTEKYNVDHFHKVHRCAEDPPEKTRYPPAITGRYPSTNSNQEGVKRKRAEGEGEEGLK